MPQIFRPYADSVARATLVTLLIGPFAAIGIAYWTTRSNYITDQTITLDQPVPFSHAHTSAGSGSIAATAIPGWKSRLSPAFSDPYLHDPPFAALHPDRDAGAGAGKPRGKQTHRWNKVNKLPDYVYFDHSIHIAKGVGCTTCHGPVDRMPLMRQAAPLTMGWCLKCHRDPARSIAARSVTKPRCFVRSASSACSPSAV